MGRVFCFELEAVLEARLRAEREAQRALAVLERERRSLLDEALRLQRSMVMSRDVLRGQLSGSASGVERGRVVDVGAVRQQAHSSLHSMIDLQRVAIKAAGMQHKVDAARAELLKAAVARKGVETLKRKRYEQWKLEQQRKEAAELDDLVLMRSRGERAEFEIGGSAT